MAASSKFDLSSSPDRPSYSCGPRWPYSGTSLDRSGSFRESIESPILSSLSSMSRSSSTATQAEIRNFFQCLRFDPKDLVTDHKFHRQGELKRLVSVALGISPENSPPVATKGKLLSSLCPEDLKKIKAGLRACTAEARERRKVFTEALSVFNNFFPTVPTRKRSRSDVISGDRASAVSLGNRFGLGPSTAKVGTLSNAMDAEQQRSEERDNNTSTNKRMRTSLLDTRVNSLSRPTVHADNKDVLRITKSGVGLGEDRSPMGIEGWGKSKLKKKRSGIKPDVSPSKVSVKTVDGNRELRMQQRLVSDLRLRENASSAFRMGADCGVACPGKLDGASHNSGSGVRSSMARSDEESNGLINEKKERPVHPDKERVNLKAVNRPSFREDQGLATLTSSTKFISSARGSLSNAGISVKISSNAQRPTCVSEWEVSQCTNRPSSSSGVISRKRTLCAQSSSAPVAHWAGQRPQKISRPARRTNFPSIIPNNDEATAFNINSKIDDDNRSMFPRRFSNSSPQQTKVKGDHTTLDILSGTESGVAEVKSREKKVVITREDEKGELSADKISTPLAPPRKIKSSGVELGDGVRRQGRTNRSLASTSRSLISKVDKFGNVRTAKQLKTSRMGLDKAESKVGRPPTRKLSDRKAYTRNKHSAVHAATDFLSLDDGKEELLAAAKDVISSSHANSYWRHMEPAFRYLSEADIMFLKQQEESMPISRTPAVFASTDGTKCSNHLNSLADSQGHIGLLATESNVAEHFTGQWTPVIIPDEADPLFQRVMGALIIDEDDCRNSGTEDFEVDPVSAGLPKDLQSDFKTLDHTLAGTSHDLFSGSLCGSREAAGHVILGVDEYDEPKLETSMMAVQAFGSSSSCGPLYNGTQPNSELIMECAEYEYANMSIHKKLLMEIQSFGLVLDKPQIRQTDDDEFSQELRHWEAKCSALQDKRRSVISKVLTSISNVRESQEKEFERCAMEKLVTIAYGKYMACFSGKAKTAMKQAALAFVLRTLDRCQEYEATGTSCFSESSFKDMFNATLNHLADAQSLDTVSDNESNRGFSLESTMGKEDALSNKVRKKELSLDDVGGNTLFSINGRPAIGGSVINNVKGKRSDRDREGKDHLGLRNGMAKIGRPVGGSTKGDRKPKAKTKQKTTQLSASLNGLLEKIPEQSKAPFSSFPKSNENAANIPKENDEFAFNGVDPVADLSSLQIPDMDVDLGGHGEDLDSWLNIDDDGLQDHDFMGLEIPMDDLSDVHLMF